MPDTVTAEQASEIYDVLVAAWSAQEQWREDFVQSLVNQDCREYRCGWGKFYLEPDCWRVGVYAEDQAEQATRIKAVNRVLAAMLENNKRLAAWLDLLADAETRAEMAEAHYDELATARRWLVWFNAGVNLRRNAISRGCTESQLAEIRESILAGIVGEQDREQFEKDWPTASDPKDTTSPD